MSSGLCTSFKARGRATAQGFRQKNAPLRCIFFVEISYNLARRLPVLYLLCTKTQRTHARPPSLPSPFYFTTVRKLTTVRNPTTAGLFSV